jgi:hypothetical protein
MNRNKFFIVHNQDVKDWTTRFSLEPFETKCTCGRAMKTSIPFAFEEYRGLISEVCFCGNTDTPFCFVRDPKRGDLFHAQQRVRISKPPRVREKACAKLGSSKPIDLFGD